MSDKISDDDWNKAKKNIKLYFDRPDPDGDQELYRDKLRNTIGFAMGLPISLKLIDKSYEAIEVIKDKIYEITPREVWVCVIPIELAYDGNLYELIVFRVVDKQKLYRFVDNCGRYYPNWDDWKDNNKLPPGFVVYPHKGHLKSDPRHPEWPDCYYVKTPSMRVGAEIVKGLDWTATGVGIGAGVASFFTGGLAIPVIAAGASVYGLVRSVGEIADRAEHKESLNPFTDSRARMIWLGVAANIVGFGAMGASMRLAFVASKGKVISDTFKAVVNALNAASLTTHTACLTNGWIKLLVHMDEMKPEDVALQFLQTAFWLKGAYSYRTAGEIITEARQGFFDSATKGLSDQERQQFQSARMSFKNDAEFIRFMRSPNSGSPQFGAQLLSELQSSGVTYSVNEHGQISLGDGNSITYVDAKNLQQFPADTRATMFKVFGGYWEGSDGDAFYNMRRQINNDAGLFKFIGQVAEHYGINAHDAARGLTNLYNHAGSSAGQLVPRIEGGNLIVARGHTFTPKQLYGYLPDHFGAINKYLVPLSGEETNQFNNLRNKFNDDHRLFGWMAKLPQAIGYQPGELLVALYSEGLLQLNVQFEENGRLILCQQLRLSLQRLNQLGINNRSTLIKAFRQYGNNDLFALKEMIPKTLRFKFEIDRKQAVDWFKDILDENRNTKIVKNFASHEMDRLVDMRSNLEVQSKTWQDASPTFTKELCCWAIKDAANVSEFASQLEFAISKLNDCYQNNKSKPNARKIAVNKTLLTQSARTELTQAFNETIKFVKANHMVGITQVSENLTDSQLITELKKHNIKFGSAKSAAYHLTKHPYDPPTEYIKMAQNTIRDASSQAEVTWSQDGTARTVSYTWSYSDGRRAYKSVVLEDRGRVLLCSFMKISVKCRRQQG